MADDGHEVAGQEFSGKTVEEATEDGLAQMGLSAAQAQVEVISRGSRGIFGIGSEPARVRISRRVASAPPATQSAGVKAEPAPAAPTPTHTPVPSAPAETAAQQVEPPSAPSNDSAAPVAAQTSPPAPAHDEDADTEDADTSDAKDTRRSHFQTGPEGVVEDMDEEVDEELDEEELVRLSSELLEQLVRHMGFECTIEGEWRDPADDESDRYLHLDIHGNDLGALIGRRGETLASIQYLVRLMINQRIRQWKPIVVDVENYKERRNNQLTQLALRMAEQVVQSGRAMSLEPMPANERRIIHLTLRDHPEVYTQSSGEGERRKVHIVAKG